MSAFVPSLVQIEREPAPTVRIRPWVDPVLDTLGHDPRHAYFETFWVGIVGPSAAWLQRRLVTMLDAGIESIDAADLARQLGWPVLGTGKNAPLWRAVDRLCHFGLCRRDPDDTIGVRRRVPPLTLHQVHRLPPTLRGAHDAWQERQLLERRRSTVAHTAHAFASVDDDAECPWCGDRGCERHCSECGEPSYDRRAHTDAGTVA